MDTDGLKRFLGRPVTDNEMESYLFAQGIDVSKELILKSGDYTAHIERPKKGFSLVFTDEAMFFNKENQPIGKGPLYLEGMFLYAEGKGGYSQYKGELPGGIKFRDHRSDVLTKLGEPNWQRKRRVDDSIVAEKWGLSGLIVHVTYSRDSHCPVVVYLGVPSIRS
ncbi:hypothetical protein [Marinobacter xestospongiae]|uniref:Uncharacterized protein n=1 Tax=Marinobacter xestospongiae TaxID=994319 RepID=A0ABU3VYF3_9GAMM|nr:hypothetical protein [Marinobacter xestospongiae]MDV2079160.1 hypothetical protein [Marinobacter xestospongiae]